MPTAYLALGSNIDPGKNLFFAWTALGKSLSIIQSSSIWESPPYGTQGSNFLNAVVQVESPFPHEGLKWQVLRPLEARMGRIRTEDKFASRTIDLDILIFDGLILDLNLWRLAYLAAPLAELLPDLKNPDTAVSLSQLAGQLAREQNTMMRWYSFPELVRGYSQ